MNVVLAILYAPEGRKPLAIARINNRELLEAAAQTAIREAEVTAAELMGDDPTLGAMQLEEATKLRRVFSGLLPTHMSNSPRSVM
jgi:hypothetical protein